jgi:hypothetical protein
MIIKELGSKAMRAEQSLAAAGARAYFSSNLFPSA